VAQFGAFFGREKELHSLVKCLEEEHVISIVGPFGAGKTRISRALIEDIQGALFLDLSESFDKDIAIGTIADTLDINLNHNLLAKEEELNQGFDQIGRFFFSQLTPVVVVDNAEQLLDFVRLALQRWCRASPQTVFIITTREGLDIEGEHVFSLDGLDVEHAVELFIDRAEKIDPDFRGKSIQNREDARPLILEIVVALDCLPLLIELVSSRVDLFSLRDLSNDLEKHLTKVRTRDPSRSERQATVVGAIDWSWSLLNEEERLALETISLFRVSFSLVALEAISEQENIAIILGRLLEKSLLKRERSKSDPLLSRFSLYESVRIYMLEKKRADSTAFSQYWAKEAALLCASFPRSRKQLDALLRDDFENFLAAFETSEGEDLESLTLVLDAFLEWRGPQSLRERILEKPNQEGCSPQVRARLAAFYLKRGNLFLAENLIDESPGLENQFPAFLFAMNSRSPGTDTVFEALVEHTPSPKRPREFELLALAFAAQGTRTQDETLLKKARKFAIATKDDLTIAKVLNAEGAILTKAGRFKDALRAYERAFALLEEGSAIRDTIAGNIGLIAHYNGDLTRAIDAYAEVEKSLLRAGLSKEAAIFSANRAGVLIEFDKIDLATDILEDSEFVLSQYESESLASITISKANIAHLRGDFEEAKALYESILDDPKGPSIGSLVYLSLLLLENEEHDKVKTHINNWEWNLYPIWDEAMKVLAEEMDFTLPVIPERQGGAQKLPLLVSQSLDNFRMDVQEVRGWLFTRLLRQFKKGERQSKSIILVRKDGGKVEIEGTKIDLSRRGPAKKLLAFLVEKHFENPDEAFDLDALFEAGWPGVKIDYESAHKRVYAAIGTLRRQGLASLIETTDEGYRIYNDLSIAFS